MERIGKRNRKTIINTREAGECINLDIKSYYSGEINSIPISAKEDAK